MQRVRRHLALLRHSTTKHLRIVTRTHEWTAAVVDNTTGLLSTTTGNTQRRPVATQTVEPFPSYLKNLEYVQFANENRNITDYSIDMTFSAPVTAYLFVDNRAGQATGTKAQYDRPRFDDGALLDHDRWMDPREHRLYAAYRGWRTASRLHWN